jgi:hypothetical protein
MKLSYILFVTYHGMNYISIAYGSVIKDIHVVLECKYICVHLFCIVEL